MIIRTRGDDFRVELKAEGAIEFGSSAIPNFGGGLLSQSGAFVTEASALGLPAVAAAVKLVAETIASMPLQIFTGQKDKRRLVNDAWQAALLFRPNEDSSQFDLISDIAASIETTGNAFIYKLKDGSGKLIGLEVLDPAWMSIFVDPNTLEKTFRYSLIRQAVTMTSVDILHVRGFTVGGYGKIGLSPVALHRHALGEAISTNEYAGRFFSQGAIPNGAIKVPGDLDTKGVDQLIEKWERRHQGGNQWHRPAVLVNGAEWVSTGLSLQDAQFVESRANSILEVARIWGIPASFLEAAKADRPTRGSTEEELHRLHLRLLPRIKRIEDAFLHDYDLFGSPDPYPEFDMAELLRTDAATAAQVALSQIQSGQRVPDELRAADGLPPLDEINPDLPKNYGKVPQYIPVGGTPFGVPDPAAPKNGKAALTPEQLELALQGGPIDSD